MNPRPTPDDLLADHPVDPDDCDADICIYTRYCAHCGEEKHNTTRYSYDPAHFCDAPDCREALDRLREGDI